MTHLLLLLALLIPAARPTSRFTMTCAPGARQCVFDGTSADSSATGAIISYLWDWGDGRSESHTTPTATNTWPAGSYCVRLTVTDRSGLTSYSTKYITLPYVSGAKFAACTTQPAPPPVKPDTVFRVDTIQLPAPKQDTVIRVDTFRTPKPAPDTIRLPAPPPDTVQLPARVDTLWKHDTISTALPILPPGIVITDPNGERDVRWNNQRLGKLMLRTDGKVEAVRYNPAVTFGQYGMKVQGIYGTQIEAIAALLLPPPPGFTWVGP